MNENDNLDLHNDDICEYCDGNGCPKCDYTGLWCGPALDVNDEMALWDEIDDSIDWVWE